MGYIKSAVKRWLGLGTALSPAAVPLQVLENKRGQVFSPAAVSQLTTALLAGKRVNGTWTKPADPHWLDRSSTPTHAMDSVPYDDMMDYAVASSPWSEGLGFMGYAYLAELWQRPEFRRLSEIWAAECTRKWIKLKGGKHERIQKLEESMRRFALREKFREAIELDGGFGRAHIFPDFGDPQHSRDGPLAYTPETIAVGSLRGFQVTEPYWTYPQNFNVTDPLATDFYQPSAWSVMGETVHHTRLLTIVGRQVPDMLKPVYMFGGISLSQMAKPAVDNFIRNRSSIGNLLHSFSTMVLSTNMSVMLSPQGAGEMIRRIQTYVMGRDNGGLQVIDKDTETLENVAAPLSGTHELLAQSLEQILIPVGIPMVVYAGQSPAGLNASSDGELKAFNNHVKGYQEKTLQSALNAVIIMLQLDLDGEIDESVTYEFVNLWELDDKARAEIRNINMTVATGYINAGVLDPEDERTRLENEEGGLWFGIKLKEPEQPPAAEGLEDGEGEDGEEADPGDGA